MARKIPVWEPILQNFWSPRILESHGFGAQMDPEAEYALPHKLTGQQAWDLLHNSLFPANMLDLGLFKNNPFPTCLANLQTFKVLLLLSSEGQIGKIKAEHDRYLILCLIFHILGGKVAFSLPHRNHHSVLTPTHGEFDEKL
jgi:hypothetical protein